MRLCPHRGFPIPDGSSACPYHGLCLSSVPASCDRSFPVFDFDQGIGDRMVEDMGDRFFSVELSVSAPWWLWMQNTADFLHVKSVHPHFSAQLEGMPFDVRISADLQNSSHKIAASHRVAHSIQRLLKKDLPKTFTHVLKYPALSMTSFMDVFYSIETAWEKGASSCLVSSHFFLSKRNRAPAGLIAAVKEANRKILDEDRQIVEAWAPTAMNGGWLFGEARVAAFNECLKRDGIIQ